MTHFEVEIFRYVLKALLRIKGISQRDLAKRVQCHWSTINKFLTGKINKLSEETNKRICKTLDISLKEILEIVYKLRNVVEIYQYEWNDVPGQNDTDKALFLLNRANKGRVLERVIQTLILESEKDYSLKTVLQDIIPYEISEKGKKEVKTWSLWPRVSLPLGGPKVSEPFAGRVEELKNLGEAMGGNRTVVAIVGMAGQGKSCLAGQWYKNGARPPEDVGLFWRKLYEPGFTFDIFLDHLHFYLTGEHIDRRQITSIDAKAAIVDDLLREKPCWIALDGVERWLKRWADRPDAGVEDTSADDRAAQEPALDKFLKGANFWDNGSKLLLITRAMPSALDESPPVRIGRKLKDEDDEGDVRLDNLAPQEAAELLEDFKVKGDEKIMLKVADAYGNHPYAVHVLGALIRDLYQGNVSEWEKVDPLQEAKLDNLFENIIEHRREDSDLLALIACSVGPLPVAMPAEILGRDENQIRKRLAELAKWQIVEFKGSAAEQHTIVRKFLHERMGYEYVSELRKKIAAWWAERDVPINPTRWEEIKPLLKVVEHMLVAGEPEVAMKIFFTGPSKESYYSVSEWMRIFGYLDENIRINSIAVRAYEDAIDKEDQRDMLKYLAMCYNNRGNAYGDQGRLDEAIVDFEKAIEIYKQLVEKENRHELRSDLAMCYNNRGLAYSDQGRLDEAIVDFEKAIEIYKQLVEKENRHELRSDLAMCYNNRGLAYRDQSRLDGAMVDYDKAIEIYKQLVEKEKRLELRNDLAKCYNNRGLTYRALGRLDDTIKDYGKVIEITEQLVEKENRRELRNDLAMCYNNRGLAYGDQSRLDEAIEDYDRSIEIYKQLVEKENRRELRYLLAFNILNRVVTLSEKEQWQDAKEDIDKGTSLLTELIEEGQRHVIESFMQTAGFRCSKAKEFGNIPTASGWANNAMQWFLEEVQTGRLNEVLLKRAAGFAGVLKQTWEILIQHGLDKELMENFFNKLNEEIEKLKPKQ